MRKPNKQNKIIAFMMLVCPLIWAFEIGETERQEFEKAVNADWKEAFSDDCSQDWTKQWFLDGEIASVSNSQYGMQLTAGPQFRNNAHHMVLWTKDEFEGDVKIEFEYTRLDFEENN